MFNLQLLNPKFNLHFPNRKPASTTSSTTATPSKPTNKIWTTLPYAASFASFTAIIFSILVIIGNTYNTHSLTNMYFLKIDVSNVIPRSFPNAALVNTIAQTLGLRDFYQVGLWNYCEGYKKRGVTYCSKPTPMYAFDPVSILMSQLLQGATIALPTTITDALGMAKTASNWMFACWFVGIIFVFLSFVIGLVPRSPHQLRTATSLIGAIFTTIAAAVSTALFTVFRSVFENRPDLNIIGTLGGELFAFMWIAAAFSIFSAVVWLARGWAEWKRKKNGNGGEEKREAEEDGRSVGSSTQVEREERLREKREEEGQGVGSGSGDHRGVAVRRNLPEGTLEDVAEE